MNSEHESDSNEILGVTVKIIRARDGGFLAVSPLLSWGILAHETTETAARGVEVRK